MQRRWLSDNLEVSALGLSCMGMTLSELVNEGKWPVSATPTKA